MGCAQCAGEPPPAVPVQATLQRELKPCPGAEATLPVRAVWHVPGSKASEQGSILILGGQGADEPDMLHVLPLQPSSDAEVRSCCASQLHPPRHWSTCAEASRMPAPYLHLKCCLLPLARLSKGSTSGMSASFQAGPVQSRHASQLRSSNSSQAALTAHTDTERLLESSMQYQVLDTSGCRMSGHTVQ